jgi:hypothetical protein
MSIKQENLKQHWKDIDLKVEERLRNKECKTIDRDLNSLLMDIRRAIISLDIHTYEEAAYPSEDAWRKAIIAKICLIFQNIPVFIESCKKLEIMSCEHQREEDEIEKFYPSLKFPDVPDDNNIEPVQETINKNEV